MVERIIDVRTGEETLNADFDWSAPEPTAAERQALAEQDADEVVDSPVMQAVLEVLAQNLPGKSRAALRADARAAALQRAREARGLA